MTKETFEYEIETCDVCKRKQKKSPNRKDNNDFTYSFSLSNYSVSSGTWFTTSKTPVTLNLDMCDSCKDSFDQWRESRENSSKCECSHND